MFITTTNHVLDARPQLTRVWIKTGDQRMPLKAVWLDEAKLRSVANADCMDHFEDEAAELTDDHLCLAAIMVSGWRLGPRVQAISVCSPPAGCHRVTALAAVHQQSRNGTMHFPA